MTWPYDRAACLAEPVAEGMRQLCPPEPAVWALAALVLAFLVLVGERVWRGSVDEYRRRRRRREFGLGDDG